VETAALLLAAGGGSRFKGGPKLLSPLLGRPLIWFSLSSALAAAPEVLIVVTGMLNLSAYTEAVDPTLREAIEELLHDPVLIEEHNPRWREGIATSLAVGTRRARALGAKAVVIGLGDQPLVPVRAWSAMLTCPAPLAVARYGTRTGHPVRIASRYWEELPSTGDTGAKSLLANHEEDLAEVKIEGCNEMALLDIDTEEDLRNVEPNLSDPSRLADPRDRDGPGHKTG
jgi:molybdenum cofactor cytidylyltransferase